MRRLISSAAVIAAIFCAAPASAGDVVFEGSDREGSSRGLSYRSTTFDGTIPGFTPEILTRCPARRVLTGGGALATGSTEPVRLLDSGPPHPETLDKTGGNRRNRWFVVYDAGAVTELKSYAICARRRGLRQKTVVSPATTATDQVVEVRARCPRGTSVTGGGFLSEGNPEDDLIASAPFDGGDRGRRPDDGWLVKVVVGQNNREVHVNAVCSSRFDLDYVSKRVTGTGSLTHTARCPRGTAVTGGGTAIIAGEIFAAGTAVNSSGPIDGGDRGRAPDDGWRARAFRDPSDLDATLRTTAICKS